MLYNIFIIMIITIIIYIWSHVEGLFFGFTNLPHSSRNTWDPLLGSFQVARVALNFCPGTELSVHHKDSRALPLRYQYRAVDSNPNSLIPTWYFVESLLKVYLSGGINGRPMNARKAKKTLCVVTIIQPFCLFSIWPIPKIWEV